MSTRLHRLLMVACVLFGVAHVLALPEDLEDLDSVNFALGVESFDVRLHRPHPPGYPVFVGLAKVSTAAVRFVAPTWSGGRVAAVGLSVWSIAAGTCAALIIAALWRTIGVPAGPAALAALMTIVSPLFWFTASRPMTDVPGLVGALLIQLGLIRGLRRFHDSRHQPEWLWWAFGAGLLVGVRTQTMWLTGPLLCWCVGAVMAQRRWSDAFRLVAAAFAGVVVWLLPLVLSSGGVTAYLTALGRQGTDDFIGVRMLATQPSWALFKTALVQTFVTPWSHRILSWAVMVLALGGVACLVRYGPRVLALVLLAFWPYLVFHLTFQEPATIRYGLPLLVPVCGLAAIALHWLGSRVLALAGPALVIASLCVAVPSAQAYSNSGSPVFRIFQDIDAVTRATSSADIPVIGMHHRVASEARQAIVWVQEAHPFTLLSTEPAQEVSSVVDHFLRGADSPIWFLADPLRHDLDAIDPRARHPQPRRRWPTSARSLLAVVRPADVDAWVIEPPEWMLDAGWSLSPEMGGVTALRRLGPHRRPARAFVRRRAAPLRMVIGGRHLGGDHSPPGVITVCLDGRALASWPISVDARRFEQWIELPDGLAGGDGRYATVSVSVSSLQRRERVPPVGLEYFDVATTDEVMWTYGEGWHEPEQEPQTGVHWRWMARRGSILVHGPDVALAVSVQGESPQRYFSRGSELVLRAGDVEIGRTPVDDDFAKVFVIPAGTLGPGPDGVSRILTLETNQVMVPADRGGSADRRELGLRVFQVAVSRASDQGNR